MVFFRIVIFFYGVAAMFLISNFYIGSNESWESSIKGHFWEVLSSRFSVTILVGFFFFAMSLLFRRYAKEKLVTISTLFEFISLIVVALFFTAIAVLNFNVA